MGLRQTISQWVETIKDMLDFGPEFPAAVNEHQVRLSDELTKLQNLLDKTRRAAQEKDELIAKLQAAGAVRGNMVIDESVYYLKREHALEGPYCLSCFEKNHEVVRIVPAPKPRGADGNQREWVQCSKCQAPFRSERIGQYLNVPRTAPQAAQASTSSEADGEAEAVKPKRKTRARTVRSKAQGAEPKKSSSRSKQADQPEKDPVGRPS